MKIEIINKPMLCWNEVEDTAREWHVLAKVTESNNSYPVKVVANENTNHWRRAGAVEEFKYCKPLAEVVEMTVAEVSKVLGKTVKIVE